MHKPCGFFSLPHHSAFDLPLGYPSCFFLLRFLSYHTLRISSVDSSKMVRIAFCMVFAMLALTLFKYKLDTFKSEYKSSMTLGHLVGPLLVGPAGFRVNLFEPNSQSFMEFGVNGIYYMSHLGCFLCLHWFDTL